MIVIKGLNKIYETKYDKVQALKNINLELSSNGFVMITGKSGSGKSTLLNILGGLETYDEGDILINNKSTKTFKKYDWDAFRNQYVGYVYQEYYLIEDMTIAENVAIALKLQNYSEDDINERVKHVLELVGLQDYSDHKPTEISGGQAQRVAIARALVKNPRLILADEPTGNLDSETGKAILELLKELSKERLVVMVTHDLEFAYKYGDRVIELKDGEIIYDTYEDDLVTNIYEGNEDFTNVIRLPKGKKLSSYLVNYISKLISENDEIYFLHLGETPPTNLDTPSMVEKTVTPKINKEVVNEDLHLTKSHLPFKYAINMVCSSFLKKKKKLILMFLSIVFALLFIGVAFNFGMYDVHKASALTFEQAGLKLIPLDRYITRCVEDNCHSYYASQSYAEEKYQEFTEKFPDIRILSSYYGFVQVEGLRSILDDQYFIGINSDVSKITILEEDITGLSYYGSIPSDNEVLITDYLLEALVTLTVLPKSDNYDTYIGKSIKVEGVPLTISGIVFTGVDKFHKYRETSRFPGEFYYNMSSGVYDHIYVNRNTFYEVLKFDTTHITIDDYLFFLSEYTHYDASYQALTIGRLPEQDNEVALTRSALEEMSKDYALGTTVTIELAGMDPQTYTLVGIIDDVDRPFIVMFSRTRYEEIIDILNERQMVAVLSESQNENINFFRFIEKYQYRHDTVYTSEIYFIQKILGQLQTLFYIIGGLFLIFGSVLVFTFILFTISDKQKEIGILRALGAKNSDISKIFITEGLIIAFVASIVANILIVIMMQIMNNTFTKAMELDVVIIYNNLLTNLLIVLIAIIMVTIATFVPIRQITKMKPIKAIKG